jgi:hypothetical protein
VAGLASGFLPKAPPNRPPDFGASAGFSVVGCAGVSGFFASKSLLTSAVGGVGLRLPKPNDGLGCASPPAEAGALFSPVLGACEKRLGAGFAAAAPPPKRLALGGFPAGVKLKLAGGAVLLACGVVLLASFDPMPWKRLPPVAVPGVDAPLLPPPKRLLVGGLLC